MSGDRDLRFAEKASELRQAFDRSFADPPRTRQTQFEDMLAIRVQANPYAVRLNEVSGLFAGKAITRLPNIVPEFLGIAGFRGAVIPVYDLRALLGYVGGDTPRWLVIVAATPVALAFDAFDGHLRLAREAISREQRVEHAWQHVREVSQSDNLVRPIVDMASILEMVKKRTQKGVPR